MEANPLNTIIHYWHFDPDFANPVGTPRPLAFEGEKGFAALVRRYAGDIPAGAIRKELERAEAISADPDGALRIHDRYFSQTGFHEDFIRNITFSLKHLADTVVFNADVVRRRGGLPERTKTEVGRFQRYAWSEHLTAEAKERFKVWARNEGARFLEQADDWIGDNELPQDAWKLHQPRVVGIGVYYFEEEGDG